METFRTIHTRKREEQTVCLIEQVDAVTKFTLKLWFNLVQKYGLDGVFYPWFSTRGFHIEKQHVQQLKTGIFRGLNKNIN